jgi:hypothetical protein
MRRLLITLAALVLVACDTPKEPQAPLLMGPREPRVWEAMVQSDQAVLGVRLTSEKPLRLFALIRESP